MAEQPSTLGADRDRNTQTGASPAVQASKKDDNVNEKPAPTSSGAPAPIQSVSSAPYLHPQTPATGESSQATPLAALSTYPAVIDCPYCRARTMTRINLTTGPQATCWSCLCCLCIGPFAALLPCICPSCKDYEHYCGNCNRPLAVVERTGAVRVTAY